MTMQQGQTSGRSLFRNVATIVIGLGAIASAAVSPAIASERSARLALDPQQHPLEMDLLEPNADLNGRHVITNATISPEALTVPSLWWTQQQFGGKLLEHWLAYPGTDGSPRRVDLVVDRQLWGLYTYLQRYTFINQFGTAAKSFGYSTRVFNDQGEPLAAYVCSFSTETLNATASAPVIPNTDSCSIVLDSAGAGAFRGRTSPFGMF